MSEGDDALREVARNRGCKLVKSRRRKPGGDYGRFGLKDAKSGKEVFGFGEDGLTASAAEIAGYLKRGAVAGWKRSLIAPVDQAPPPAKRRRAEPRAAKPERRAAPKRAAARPPAKAAKRAEPEAPRPPRVREARPGDAEPIAGLLAELGYKVTAADVRRRLTAMRKASEPALVAERGGVIGALSWHVTPVLHRPRPVGRITMMVVAEEARGEGVGTLLVEAAEQRLRERGCGMVEVTSNISRLRAHAFYRDLGYERTSYRFAKALQD